MIDEAGEHVAAHLDRLEPLSNRSSPYPRRTPANHARIVRNSAKVKKEPSETTEREAARFLIKSLSKCYGVDFATIHGDVWELYRRFMRAHWGLGEAESLTATECLRGFRNNSIALRLGLGAETVNRQLDRVYRKAGVRGRAELAALLLQLAAAGVVR